MRLPFDDLERLEGCLFERLCTGQLDIETYSREWDALVTFAGWTWDEVVLEIDARWETPYRKPRPVFLC